MTKNSDGTGPLSRGAGGAAAAAAPATCAKTTTRATSGIEGTMLDRRVSEKAALKEAAATLYLMALAAAAAAADAMVRPSFVCVCVSKNEPFGTNKNVPISAIYIYISETSLFGGTRGPTSVLGLLPESKTVTNGVRGAPHLVGWASNSIQATPLAFQLQRARHASFSLSGNRSVTNRSECQDAAAAVCRRCAMLPQVFVCLQNSAAKNIISTITFTYVH